MSQDTLKWLEDALQKIPQLLTLEDFVGRWGRKWGFQDQVIEQAQARAQYFDTIAGFQRYTSDEEAQLE
jgi:hypothetical protein